MKGLHPIAILLLPVPAGIIVLRAPTPWFGLICVAVTVVLAGLRGWRQGAVVAGIAVIGLGLVGGAYTLAMPADALGHASAPVPWLGGVVTEDQLTLGLSGALRIVAISLLLLAALIWVRWPVLADSLIERWRAPYRVVDVVGLGGRFVMVMRRELSAARAMVRRRSRGRWLKGLRMQWQLVVPVLMATFTHANELAMAMDARGFGLAPKRTVHVARPLRVTDAVSVVIVWATSIALGVALW